MPNWHTRETWNSDFPFLSMFMFSSYTFSTKEFFFFCFSHFVSFTHHYPIKAMALLLFRLCMLEYQSCWMCLLFCRYNFTPSNTSCGYMPRLYLSWFYLKNLNIGWNGNQQKKNVKSNQWEIKRKKNTQIEPIFIFCAHRRNDKKTKPA